MTTPVELNGKYVVTPSVLRCLPHTEELVVERWVPDPDEAWRLLPIGSFRCGTCLRRVPLAVDSGAHALRSSQGVVQKPEAGLMCFECLLTRGNEYNASGVDEFPWRGSRLIAHDAA